MGYSEDDSMVRVDFFKPSGKWYMTETMKWTGKWKAADEDLHTAFAHSLIDHCSRTGRSLSDFTVVCLEPYHEHSFPLMIDTTEFLRRYSERNE